MKQLIYILTLFLGLGLQAQTSDKCVKQSSIVEKGKYLVYYKDSLISSHTKYLKAAFKADEVSIANNGAKVTITHPSTEVKSLIDCPEVVKDTVINAPDIDPLPEPKSLLAFPTAVGGGAYATGGRGGFVYHLTRLDDPYELVNINGRLVKKAIITEGTIRWALMQPRPATLIADVSGIIQLNLSLVIKAKDLTIAFQSAPLGGITITYPVGVNFYIDNPSENMIMRYVKLRAQFDDATGFKIDSDRFDDSKSYANNIIISNVSISWAGLQGFTVRGRNTEHITFQDGLIGECKTGSLFGEVSTSHTGESQYLTFTRTHFYNTSHRTPNSAADKADIYNNSVYNYDDRLSVFANGAKVNYFNNYTFKAFRTSLVTQYGVFQFNGGTNNASVDLSIYAAGNIIEDLFTDPNADNKAIFMEHANSSQKEMLDHRFFVDKPFDYVGYMGRIMTAYEVRDEVPINAGSNKYLNADGTYGIYRDFIDDRYVSNTINNTPEAYVCCRSGANGKRHSAIKSDSYKNFLAWITDEPINERPYDFYISNPHIPEAFLIKVNEVGSDHNKVMPDGYTLLEWYLNGVDNKKNKR